MLHAECSAYRTDYRSVDGENRAEYRAESLPRNLTFHSLIRIFSFALQSRNFSDKPSASIGCGSEMPK